MRMHKKEMKNIKTSELGKMRDFDIHNTCSSVRECEKCYRWPDDYVNLKWKTGQDLLLPHSTLK